MTKPTFLFRNKIIKQILAKYQTLWALGYVAGLAEWDLETYMPAKGVQARGEALAKLASLRQKLFLDKEFVRLIRRAAEEKRLNDYEKGVVRLLNRTLKFYSKLPASFLEEFERLTKMATVVWRRAKAGDNFDLFAPYLAKIFRLARQKAEYLGYLETPYDALLDEFEEGLTVKTVEPFFAAIKKPLTELLAKIKKSKNYFPVHPLEKTEYDQSRIEALNFEILKLFQADFDRFRVDKSAHPFTSSFAATDSRITTWYHKSNFGRSVLALIHEFGHALYDLQCDDRLKQTPLDGGSSLVIHESQSRFWENFIGRSRPMAEFIARAVPDLGSSEEIYRYLNKVSPGFLRVEADEVTYHFHVLLRYEIEKGLIEQRIKIKELREYWNAKMKEYLGIVPKKDSEGILQDIHWSGGMIGYFPTYSLGTALSVIWAKSLGPGLRTPNYPRIKSWLERHIHRYGSTYTLADLLKINRLKFSSQPLLDYLEKKYSSIYN